MLYHQLLSRLTEMHGCTPRDLVAFFIGTKAFPQVTPDDYMMLLKHLIAIDHIQQMSEGDLILGITGERIVRSREFYAVFQTPPEWDVRHTERTIGRVAPSPDLVPGTFLLLAGKVWQVTEILQEQKQLLVIPAKEARNVLFLGTGIPEMHPKIAQRVREILDREDVPRYLSPVGQTALAEARVLCRSLELSHRSIFESDNEWVIFPWTGSRAARTLQFVFKQAGFEAGFPDMLFPWVMTMKRDGDMTELKARLKELLEMNLTAVDLINTIPAPLLKTHKFDEYVPDALLRARAVEEWIDWEEAQVVLRRLAQNVTGV